MHLLYSSSRSHKAIHQPITQDLPFNSSTQTSASALNVAYAWPQVGMSCVHVCAHGCLWTHECAHTRHCACSHAHTHAYSRRHNAAELHIDAPADGGGSTVQTMKLQCRAMSCVYTDCYARHIPITGRIIIHRCDCVRQHTGQGEQTCSHVSVCVLP